jgi:hypothetical protein
MSTAPGLNHRCCTTTTRVYRYEWIQTHPLAIRGETSIDVPVRGCDEPGRWARFRCWSGNTPDIRFPMVENKSELSTFAWNCGSHCVVSGCDDRHGHPSTDGNPPQTLQSRTAGGENNGFAVWRPSEALNQRVVRSKPTGIGRAHTHHIKLLRHIASALDKGDVVTIGRGNGVGQIGTERREHNSPLTCV